MWHLAKFYADMNHMIEEDFEHTKNMIQSKSTI